jgi:hypothetical protein
MLNLKHAGSILHATQPDLPMETFIMKKCLSSLSLAKEITPASQRAYEPFIYGQIYCINNSVCKYVLK